MKARGGNASKIPLEVLEGDLKKMQFLVKVKEYVSSFAPEEQQSVVERIAKEGFPPELLASPDSFIIEGNETVH